MGMPFAESPLRRANTQSSMSMISIDCVGTDGLQLNRVKHTMRVESIQAVEEKSI